MKYLFIKLKVIDGEREYILYSTLITKANCIQYVAQRFAAEYFGLSKRSGDYWIGHNGEVAITLLNAIELTQSKYNLLETLF